MEHKSYDLRKMHEISGGDEAFIRDMLVTFVENVTDSIEKIQASKLVEDWTVIGGIAHKLASNFAYMGADSLQSLAGDIERSILVEHNLTGIAEKTDKLCSDSISLINQVKYDFDINFPK